MNYQEPTKDDLAAKWNERIASAKEHWSKFHRRVKHNRNLVSGFDWQADPTGRDFNKLRANLINGTINTLVPSVYAKNPEISITPRFKADNLGLFCKTLELVTNTSLEEAKLKIRAKSTIRGAMTASFALVKVMYQRDTRQDPIIKGRINDSQDNILEIEKLLCEIDDPAQCGELALKKSELENLIESLNQQVEVVAAEGIVIDRVLTDNILIDPTICEFWDYPDADWICQLAPMKKRHAEAMYKLKLDKATLYNPNGRSNENRLASGNKNSSEDSQIVILEIWDKTKQTVYTIAEGCDFWLRDPYSPMKAGERWYLFFLLPFQTVDGQFVSPSIVDLTEKLQEEHNKSRDSFNEHRDLCLPGWIASGDISEKSIKRYTDQRLGEITILDIDGRPLNQVITPRTHPPIDPIVYDTSNVRQDWEMVTGLQDAARSTVVQPKTATEASILQQALSGRIAEFRDQIEDWLQEIATYTAQILIQELTTAQVERIAGPDSDWPELTKDEVFNMVNVRIRAGTTSAPDKFEQQEAWSMVLPIVQNLTTQIMQLNASGMDTEPLKSLMRETIARFDEKLDVEKFLPKQQLTT